MFQSIQLRILVDNQAPVGLCSEHGFSAWIEADGTQVLFDTGAGRCLTTNAEKLGINLARVSALVLSHGHYDHSGGLVDFLRLNQKANIHFGLKTDRIRYACHPDQPPRNIGMPAEAAAALAGLPLERRHLLHEPHWLAPGIGVTGPIPRLKAFEDTGGPFYLDPEKQEKDTIVDEQALWLQSPKGLVIVVGCCHAGIVNTVNYIRRISGFTRIHALFGGLHLQGASEERFCQTLQALKDWQPDLLVPCHCTGEKAVARLIEALGSNMVCPGQAGQDFKLDS